MRRRAWVLGGVALALLLAAAWYGRLPGTWRIRAWLYETMQKRRLAKFEQDAPTVPQGTVVFIGSSTIQGFPMERLYAGRPFLNRGIGGETAAELLARLGATLPVARPAGVVIYTGVNDVRAKNTPPEVVAVSMDAIVRMLRARYADVPIAVVEVFHLPGEPDEMFATIAELNRRFHQVAEAHGAAFVRTGRPPIADDTGRMLASMSNDGQHLNDAGYESLARWIAADGGAATAPLR